MLSTGKHKKKSRISLLKWWGLFTFILVGVLLSATSCTSPETPNENDVQSGMSDTTGGDDGKTDPQDTGGADTDQGSDPDPDDPPAEPDKSNAVDVDLILFMGQSNMAGRGSFAESAPVGEGHAYEFKAVSDPSRLYPLNADFGVAENTANGANDKTSKTGSLVPAFCEAYFQMTQTPVVAVSCSQGGTRIDQWQLGGGKLDDAIERLNKAKQFLDASEDYRVRHIYMVWCQGESDARNNTSAERYQELTVNMFEDMHENGVEKCFLIGIGNYNGTEDPADSFAYIQQAQKELCATQEDFVMVSTRFAELQDRMKDDFHFYQDAYNLVGEEAGRAAGAFVCGSSQTGPSGLTFSKYDSEHRDEVVWD